jgi:hypothetical protein
MRKIYWLLSRFGWGFGLVSSVLAMIRDIGTILIFLALLFGIKFGITWDAGIGLASFFLFVGLGELLKRKGYLDYATKLGNSVNPEIQEILTILKK